VAARAAQRVSSAVDGVVFAAGAAALLWLLARGVAVAITADGEGKEIPSRALVNVESIRPVQRAATAT
jgi:hypothetical protein